MIKKILVIVIITFVYSCNKNCNKNVVDLLQNPKNEDDIYNAILEDTNRLTKFMDKLIKCKNCKLQLCKSNMTLNMFCSNEKTDSIKNRNWYTLQNQENLLFTNSEADSFMCDKTCTFIIKQNPFNQILIKKNK